MTSNNLSLKRFAFLSFILCSFSFFGKKNIRLNSFVLFFLFSSINIFAQEPKVSGSIDSTQIQIGEQITYSISVETDSTDLVVFPEGQTFVPLEMVESYDTDTTQMQDRHRLVKKYALTQFDSGSYTIPQQRIIVNEDPYFTDSLQVEVATVVVDTTKQQMYPIKPAMEVPDGFEIPEWVWWLLGILTVLGIAYYFFRRKKQKEEAEKQLPPYERALFELQQLDESQLLEKRETKEYYSKLTEAVRRYLEDDVHLRALESTTSELIHYLETKMEAGELKLSRQTIDDLKIILQRADLAKFANSRPDIFTAKEDRSKIEHVIKDTKAAIPEPTEEELLKDEAYREEQLRKRRQKRIATGVIGGLAVLAIAVTILGSTIGFANLKDSVFGNPTKELLQGEWIRSDYGDPAVSLNTPRVLKRGEINMPQEAEAMLVGSETFLDGSLAGDFYVVVSTMRFRENVDFDLDKAVEGVYADLEQKGARNIIVKDEEFTTLEGADGIKVYGTLDIEHPVTERPMNKEYMILNFAEKGGFQQITVIFDEDDPYAQEIAGRIVNSVEFENTEI